MTGKVRGLKKLVGLYGQVEQIRSLQARAAAAAVDEVLRAVSKESAARAEEHENERLALRNGDRDGWVVAVAQAEAAGVRQRRLEPLQSEREIAYQQAALAHQASRQRLEQIEGIAGKVQAREMEMDSRRTQAAADDRYLSRRVWMQTDTKR